MTNNEAITWLRGIREQFTGNCTTDTLVPISRCDIQAIGLAIKALEERPQGKCKGCEYLKDCETCEDKAKQYSLGFQDGYLTGGFQLTELRRWLIAQGYSEGTVDDKIEGFQRFVKRIREDEG